VVMKQEHLLPGVRYEGAPTRVAQAPAAMRRNRSVEAPST
jgi:hypothetical protein